MENDHNTSAPASTADADTRFSDAVACHQRGEFDAAAAICREILALAPSHANALHMLAVLEAQKGNAAGALELMDRALAQTPNNANLHFDRGNILRDLNRPEEALASYQAALKINSALPAAHYGCGNALRDLGRLEQALASYDAALGLYPEFPAALYNRGKTLHDLKRPDQALACYDRALRIHPDFAEAHCSRGEALQDLNRFHQALASYERAIQINPEFGVALYHRGNVLFILERPEDALRSYERALQLYHEFPEAAIKHADVLKHLTRHDEALASYDRAISLKPDTAELHNNRGIVLHALARFEDALADYDRAIVLDPLYEYAYINRGNALKALQRIAEGGKDVVWLPTSPALVEKMLDLVGLTPNDYVIDLGSGDGRIVIAAAKRSARALGIEYNSGLVEQSKLTSIKEGVSNKASFLNLDLFEVDISAASVLTMFLSPEMILKLHPKLLELKPGTRVVSNTFTAENWAPDETAKLQENAESKIFFTAHLWIVPAKVDGVWSFAAGELALKQSFQKIDGTLVIAGIRTPILNAKLRGEQLSFSANGSDYAGRVSGNIIEGTVTNGGVSTAWVASRRVAGLD